MKNLFNEADYQEVLSRLEKLTPATERKWGKMSPAQMLAHCSAAFEVALGDRSRPRSFLGYIFGGMMKKKYVYSTSYSQNDPTDPSFKITDDRDFNTEKRRLLAQINRFHEGGEKSIKASVHPFFGKMTPIEWAQLKYNHLNHHLTQFGI